MTKSTGKAVLFVLEAWGACAAPLRSEDVRVKSE